MPKRGRPTIYSETVAMTICDRLAMGEPLAQICRDDGMPATSTVYQWRETDETFYGRFVRAREDGFDVIALDALRIADTPLDGRIETRKPVLVDGKPIGDAVEVRYEDMLGHRRLQVETRLKLLAKWDPKRYGDKTLLGSDPSNPLPVGLSVYFVKPDVSQDTPA